VDLVERYSALLPALVISAILGLRRSDIPHFTRLVYSVSRFLSFTYAPEDLQTIKDDAEALNAYVDEALAARRSDAGSTNLCDFVADAAAKGDLSQREMLVQIVTLIIGGTDTTRVAMASQTSLLLQHRAQWDAICANPALVRAAVAEAMRFEPSVGSVGRIAAEPIELDGYLIPKGEYITLSTMSAMRDETVYDQPDAFDIHRTDQCRPHLVFGAG
jgi:cytochrome P450